MSARTRSHSADDLGPVLLKVTVEVSDDHSEVIQVRERDDPRSLAARFIRTHGIAEDLQEPLTLHIERTLARVLQTRSEQKPQRTPSPARPEPEKRTKPLRSRSSASVAGSRPSPAPVSARGATAARSQSEDRLARRPHSARKPQEPDKVDSVFTKLYAEALQLRAKREAAIAKEQDEQQRRTQTPRTARATPRPGSATPWTRTGSQEPGRHLYKHAQQQLKARTAKIERAAEEREQREMQGVTFKPSIHRSQRAWPGAARARTPESQRRWVAKRKAPKPEEDLTACLFQPTINEKSSRLVALRLARLNISGPLHEHLYVDAQRRQLRVEEQAQELPKEATFRPQIGLLHYREKDQSQRALSDRLARGKERSQPEPRNTFKPQTGRPPTTSRQSELPIGEHLHEMGKALQAVKRRIAEKENAETLSRDQPKVGPASRAMLDEAKRKMFREVFLTLGGADGVLRHGECGDVPADHPLESFVNSESGIRACLAETRTGMSFGEFCDKLDRVICLTRVPSAHLFVGHRVSETQPAPTRTSSERAIAASRRRSERLASRRRDPEQPIYDTLMREKRDSDDRVAQARLRMEQDEQRECTFQPNARAPPCSAQALRAGVSPALDASRAAVERTMATVAHYGR